MGATAAMLAGAGLPLTAQDPVRLPGMVVTAPKPGPHVMVGVVRDTAGNRLPDAEVIIPGYAKKLYSNAEGVFRFEGVPKGKHKMRARKVGYAPQVREFDLDDDGGVAEFELVPMARSLPAIVSSVDRLGISGVVGDTAYQAMPDATVRLLANGKQTITDSLGGFHMPAEPGRYMVRIAKPGFIDKVVSVTVPRDSGRRITAWLQPRALPIPVREVHNIDDLQSRIAWVKPTERVVFTHEDLVKFGSEWVYDAVESTRTRWTPPQIEAYSRDCMVVVNGGPSIVNLEYLTVDEVESIEVYGNRGTSRGTPGGFSLGRRGRSVPVTPATFSNVDRAAFENQTRVCPRVVYVWLR